MPKIYNCQKAKSDIIELKVLNSSLVAYATKFHGIKIFDFESCDTKKSIADMHLNSTVSASAFSPNSELFAFANNHNIYILEISSKNISNTIESGNEDIEIISFDSSSNYIIAGSKNGRVLQYKTDKPSLLSRLGSFPYNDSNKELKYDKDKNFVSSFAFYKNKFACSGYGGAIITLNLHTQTDKKVFTYNKIRIDALAFLDEETLICAKSDGSLDIIPLDDTSSRQSISTPLSSIKQINIMPNPNFIMINGRSNIISIIDIKNRKIAHSKYIELDTQIKFVNIVKGDYLVIALENNDILHVELPGIAKLKSLIAAKSIDKAYELIAKEPMIQGSNEHKILEEKFEKKYQEALLAPINQNKKKAVQIMDIYKNVKSKQERIKELFSAFENYLRFQKLFLEKKYPLAYAMSSKYEPLKQTAQYKKMEQIFKAAFTSAQKQIMQNNIQGARAILGEYGTVISKKPLIKLLLTQNKEFIEFLKALQKKDFKTIDILVKANPFF